MIYFELFFRQQGAFLAVMAVLLAMSFATPLRLRLIGPEIALLSWALAALGLYSLVFVTARYIAPFVVLFWAALLAVVRLPDTKYGRRLLQTGSALLIAFVWVNIGTQNLEGLAGVTGFTPMSESVAPRGQFSDGHHGDNPAIAEGLLANGLEKGDKVGFLGYSYSAYWARLARLKIVAEIYPEHLQTFWQLDALRQAEVLQSFAGSGATAVISEPLDADPTPPGWVPIGQTGYLLYFIR
jgi:hypothetical protein